MIERLDQLSMRWGHAGPRMLSRHLDGELSDRERRALEAHLGDCARCRVLSQSLSSTIRALGSLQSRARPGVAESVITALRASTPPETRASARPQASPSLTVVRDAASVASGLPSGGPESQASGRRVARALMGHGLRRPQLRLTLPLGLLVGIALSVINQGTMIFSGRANLLEVCLTCSPNFLIPFVALNVGLLLAARVARRRGF
jgi:hypothetical protein